MGTFGRRGLLALAASLVLAGNASAQPINPVYLDDSPRAADVLGQVGELAEQGNEAEAVRALQAILETDGQRLVADDEDPEIYRSVRSRVHEALLARPELLERYRLTSSPLASRMLEEGEAERVERELLLTPAGFDAAVRLADDRFARADFDAARRLLLQLERHPDLAGERAARAAALLTEIARFRGSEDDLAIAQRWSAEVPAALDAVEPPSGALEHGYAAFEPMGPLADRDPLERPLRSTPYGAPEADPSLVTDAERPWILPTVAGDALLINDGEQIECFDTATLEPRWTFKTNADRDPRTRGRRTRGRSQPVEDTMTVTVGGGVAVAALGETFGRRRWGDGRLHALELDTGRRLWSVGPGGIDEELDGAMFHGPVVISGDTVVAGLFTFAPLRRVHLCHLVGLDLYTGQTRWVRLVGTAGVMPSQRGLDSAPAMRVHDGLVYRASPLGVITAVEAASGRVAWSRLVPAAVEARATDIRAWMQHAPTIHDGTLITIEPDHGRVAVLNAETGERIGDRPVMDLGWPDYMVRVGERLVFVGTNAFRVTSIDGVLTETPTTIDRANDPRVGRAIVSGQMLIEPTRHGVQLIDPAARTARHARLELPGAPAVADGQLLVVGPLEVHGYLDWASAQTVLRDRIAADPADPTPAIALAELAFRADDFSAIAPAAGSALEAAEQSADARAQARLYTGLLAMLESGEIEALAVRGQVVDQLERAAATPGERVGVAMQRGAWHRDASRGRPAAEAFQSVLDDPRLAAAQYQTRWRLERGDRAATAALVSLIEKEGPGVYSRFASAARESFAELAAPADTSGRAFESLARRFPVAPNAPDIWLRASEAYESAGEPRLARSALRNGFDAASRRGGADSATARELAGRLALALAEGDKLYAALQVIDRASSLTRAGEPVDAAALRADLLARLGARSRAPRIGAVPTQMAQLLGGWETIEPLSARGPRATSHLLMRSERQGVIALWSLGDEAGQSVEIDWQATVLASPDAPSGLVPVWTRPLGPDAASEPIVVSLSPTSALFYYGSYDAARLESVDTVTGQSQWASPVFSRLFEGRPARYDTGVLETPLDGQVWLRDHLLVVSDSTVGIVERFGRVALFDRETGAPVMVQQLDVPMIYEAALDGGALAVVGERPGDPEKNEGDGVVPMAAAYDVATGEPLFGPVEYRERRSFGRWVRLAEGGTMLLGLDLGVIGIDLSRGEPVWTVDDPAVRLSGDCIVGRDRAYVVGVDRQLWQIDLATGRLRNQPLQDLSRVSQASSLTAKPTPDGGLLVASDVGLAVFDRLGNLIGGDAYNGSVSFCQPVITDGLVVAVADRAEQVSAEDARESDSPHRSYRFAAMQRPDGAISAERTLKLHGTPRTIHALDEFIIIGMDDSVAVYHAPPSESEADSADTP